MTYLLLTMLAFYGLTLLSAGSVGEGDDFGSAFVALLCGAISAVLAIIYIGLAFWNYKFL